MKSRSRSLKVQGHVHKAEKEFALPDCDTISEWFAEDQEDRLKKLSSPSAKWSKYSVYQVYSRHSKTM